jgi:hypothetical protein
VLNWIHYVLENIWEQPGFRRFRSSLWSILNLLGLFITNCCFVKTTWMKCLKIFLLNFYKNIWVRERKHPQYGWFPIIDLFNFRNGEQDAFRKVYQWLVYMEQMKVWRDTSTVDGLDNVSMCLWLSIFDISCPFLVRLMELNTVHSSSRVDCENVEQITSTNKCFSAKFYF